jgi:hypothetical protein
LLHGKKKKNYGLHFQEQSRYPSNMPIMNPITAPTQSTHIPRRTPRERVASESLPFPSKTATWFG